MTRIAAGLTARDLGLAAFYRNAFGFDIAETRHDNGLPRILGSRARAESAAMSLGDDTVTLVAFRPPGQAYPAIAVNDIRFQHFAIVVSDIAAAYARLQSIPGWTAISRDGPQRLPTSSGGVTAFKFSDPEGHPLELLEFSADVPKRWRNRRGLYLGIDHSAIAVADAERALTFYREGLGLSVTGHSLNRGPEQESLDGVACAIVEVAGLRAGSGIGIELLAYARPAAHEPAAATDVAATRLILTVDDLGPIADRVRAHGGTVVTDQSDGSAFAARDLDGHILVFTTAR